MGGLMLGRCLSHLRMEPHPPPAVMSSVSKAKHSLPYVKFQLLPPFHLEPISFQHLSSSDWFAVFVTMVVSFIQSQTYMSLTSPISSPWVFGLFRIEFLIGQYAPRLANKNRVRECSGRYVRRVFAKMLTKESWTVTQRSEIQFNNCLPKRFVLFQDSELCSFYTAALRNWTSSGLVQRPHWIWTRSGPILWPFSHGFRPILKRWCTGAWPVT